MRRLEFIKLTNMLTGGSAPEMVGKGIANPCEQILSVAMMLRHSFGMDIEARVIVNAIRRTIIGMRL